MEIQEAFCTRLNKALEYRNLKPVDLARWTGISESTISQYRSGYSKPKEKKLAMIATALNVNPAWLMGLDVPMMLKSDPDKKTDPEKLQKAITLYDLYREADPNIQAAIDSLLRSPRSSPEHPD